MAFTSVIPKQIKGNTAQMDYQGGPDENVIYLVTSDDPADTALAACTATAGGVSVPALLSPHPTFAYTQLLLLNKSTSRDGNVFEVSCKYGIPKFNFEQPHPAETTSKWNKSLSVSTVVTTEEVDKTYDGKIITNLLGDAYKPGLTKEFYDKEIQVNFSTRTVNVQALGYAIGRINSDNVPLVIPQGNFRYTFPPKTLKVTNVQYSTAAWEDGTFYWNVSLTLGYRHLFKPGTTTEVGWNRLVPNKGYNYMDGSGNKQKSSTEVYLTSPSSQLLATGATAVLLEFALDEPIAFTGASGVLNGI